MLIYNNMPGQNPSATFHVNRDRVRDNLTVVQKLRLVRGSKVQAQKTYGSVELTGSPPEGTVSMPYAGNLYLTVTGGPGTVTINNPVISSAAYTPVMLNGQPGTGATVTATAPGQATLDTTDDGVYVVSVGTRTL